MMGNYLYRPHCGGIDEAMKGLKEFKSITAMLEYVYENHCFGDETSIDDIQYEMYYSSPDNRIGWKETYIIHSKGRAGCGWFTKNLSKKESLKVYNKWRSRK